MSSMYRGKRKFSQEQLIFFAEALFASAFDRIASQLPDCVSLDEYKKHEKNIDTFFDGINNMLGMSLAVLIAQVTGEGCGTCDWGQCTQWHKMVDDFIKERTDPVWPGLKPGDLCHPDCRKIAERFVAQNFQEYFTDLPEVKLRGWVFTRAGTKTVIGEASADEYKNADFACHDFGGECAESFDIYFRDSDGVLQSTGAESTPDDFE